MDAAMPDQNPRDWIIERLQELPDQRCPGYERAVYELRPRLQEYAGTLPVELLSRLKDIEPWKKQKLQGYISNPTYLFAWITGIADSDDISTEIRFNAYFVQQIYYWRHSDYKEFRDNVKRYHDDFSGQPMWNHQQAMASLSRFDGPGLQKALRQARIARRDLPESPGIQNLYAEVVAELGERYPDTIEKTEVSAALDAIDTAIDFDSDYGKYHANRARLLSLTDQFDAAERYMRQAIETEPSNGIDNVGYFIRVLRYEAQWGRILARRRDQEQQKILNELRRTRSDTMLMLGLLATIVGFIVTGFNIAAKYEPLVGAAIIGMLAGLILIVFAGFAMIVSWNSPPLPRILVALFGVLLILFCAVIFRMADLQDADNLSWLPTP